MLVLVGCAVAVLALPAHTRGQLPALSGPLKHARGQNVVPVYEGWYRGRDGAIHVSFGYLNKNYEEALDIPVGPQNKVEPGPADQGQPTHFLPRRQWGVFVVTLPKDHPKTAEVTWTLSIRGRTETVPANLSDLYLIDALEHVGWTEEGTTPPVLTLAQGGESAIGPAGLARTLTASVGQPVPLQIWIAESRAAPPGATASSASSGRPRGRSPFNVMWAPYRGRAVRLSEARPAITEGTAKTEATFTEPGEYTLRVVAVRGTGFAGQCCWTNGYVKVTVVPAAKP